MAPFLKKIQRKDIPRSIATGRHCIGHCRHQYFRSEMDGEPIILQVEIKATAMMASLSEKSSEPQGHKLPSSIWKAALETLPPLLMSSEETDPLPPPPVAVNDDDWVDTISNLSDDIDADIFLGDTEENLATLLQEPHHDESQLGFSSGTNNCATVEAQLRARLQHQQPQLEPTHSMYEPANLDDLAELNEFSQLLLDDIMTTVPVADVTEDGASRPHEHYKKSISVVRRDSTEVQPLQAAQLTLGPNDVVMGRGGLANNHSGNKKFHRKKKDLQPKYLSSSRNQKRKVAKKLADWVFLSGGRFLQKTEPNGEWEEAPFDKVILKSSQALRTVKDN